jgi:predicted ArsR family transcriptional regulator
MSDNTNATPFDSLPEGAARTNAELVFAVLGKKAKQVSDIVVGLQSKYKDADKHLSEIQVKAALKTLANMDSLIMSENVATGSRGRPPKAYKRFSAESATPSDTAQA